MSDPTPRSSGSHPRMAPAKAWGLLLLTWLVPGSGFLFTRQFARAIALFLLITVPFLFSVLFLKGAVLPPAWTPGDYGFNIVNSLTFVTQVGNGLLSLTWLVGRLQGVGFFQGIEEHALFELASFYMMVSGAMNYFAVCSFYDRHIAPRA